MLSPDDYNGYSYDDWVTVHDLWENNSKFQSYFEHHQKYLEFSHELFMFGFYFYEDLIEDQKAQKEEQDSVILKL